MAKRKKTRKQKILADSRRKPVMMTAPQASEMTPSDSTPEFKYSLNKSSIRNTITSQRPNNSTSSPSKIITSDYKYLRSDLTKTILLTGFVAVIEIVIKVVGKI